MVKCCNGKSKCHAAVTADGELREIMKSFRRSTKILRNCSNRFVSILTSKEKETGVHFFKIMVEVWADLLCLPSL